MSYREEFPDYPVESMPALPEGWTDWSWKNETSPSFIHEGSGLVLWIDYPDQPERFTIYRCYTFHEEAGWQFDGDERKLFACDHWDLVLKVLPALIAGDDITDPDLLNSSVPHPLDPGATA